MPGRAAWAKASPMSARFLSTAKVPITPQANPRREVPNTTVNVFDDNKSTFTTSNLGHYVEFRFVRFRQLYQGELIFLRMFAEDFRG